MSVTASGPTFDAAAFRRALGHVPTAVSVVTAVDEWGPVGMTVGTFTSISLDPPLVGFFADSGSATLARIRTAGRFCVNVLSDTQHSVCASFASRSGDRFAGIGLRPHPSGPPQLADSLAWIDCDVDSVAEVGDHAAVVGAVRGLETATVPVPRPLVFFRGKLCHLDRRTVPASGTWQLDHYADW
jgi:flavin reductase (DIM6/NTAB) family NADH-FMN oxidoreductase RutF